MNRRVFVRSLSLAVVGSTFVPRFGRWFRPNSAAPVEEVTLYWSEYNRRVPPGQVFGFKDQDAYLVTMSFPLSIEGLDSQGVRRIYSRTPDWPAGW